MEIGQWTNRWYFSNRNKILTNFAKKTRKMTEKYDVIVVGAGHAGCEAAAAAANLVITSYSIHYTKLYDD